MKPKIYILTLLATCLGNMLQAQNPYITPETVAIVAQWEEGDTATFLYESSSETTQNAEVKDYFSRSGEIFVQVAKAEENFYILHWSYKNLVTDNKSSLRLKIFGNLMSQSVFKYKVSETGQFEELLNWGEIRTRANQQLDSMMKITKEEDQKLLIKGIKSGLQSKDAVTSFLGQDIIYFHYIMGLEFSRKEPLKSEGELPNLFLPEKPYPCELTITTDSIQMPEEHAYFSFTQIGVEAACTEILIESVQKLAKGVKRKEIEEKITSFEMRDDNYFVYDLKTGWPVKIEMLRNSDLVLQKSKVKLTIQRK